MVCVVTTLLLYVCIATGHAGADKPPSGRRQKPAKGSKTTAGGGGRERAGSVMQHRQVMVTQLYCVLPW